MPPSPDPSIGSGRLAGKVALVTGAARGMGESHARRFVAEGARVVLSDVLDDLGEAVAAQLGDAAVFVHHDVTSERSWGEVVSRAEQAFGGLDVLVNNAGILRYHAVHETPPDEFRQVLDVNLVGPFLGKNMLIPLTNVSALAFIFSCGMVALGRPRFSFHGRHLSASTSSSTATGKLQKAGGERQALPRKSPL